MKKVLAILLSCFTLFIPVLSVAGWVTANQVTVAWDLNDTSGLVEGERLRYEVFLTNAITDKDKANPASVGMTETNSLQITLAVKGKYRAGVRAVLEVLGDDGVTWEKVAWSEVSWSDDPTVTKDGEIFGIRFYPSPNKPSGLTAGG